MLASVTPQDGDGAGQVSQLEREVVATVSAVKPQKGLVTPSAHLHSLLMVRKRCGSPRRGKAGL